MSHPILIAALAEDRRRWCPCGAVDQLPRGLCRACRAVAASQRQAAETTRRTSRARIRSARLAVLITSLLKGFSAGAKN